MHKQRGFTLIELMVVVMIVGILASIALPAYKQSVQKGNRSGAEQMMMQMASLEQQYFQDSRSFTADMSTTGLHIAQTGWTCTTTGCSNTYYSVVVTPYNTATPPYFTVMATVCASCTQKTDGNLYLNLASDLSTYSAGNKYRDTGDGKW